MKICATSFSLSRDVTVVFLDANVLAKPVTRTLLMVGAAPSGFRAVWSSAAEQEAARHMRPRALPPARLRARLGLVLSPSGRETASFVDTKGADRQILADAVVAGAQFLITEDVDDFGLADLDRTGMSAVNPDLFLAERLTRDAYATVIDLLVEQQIAPPTTRGRFHAAIARQHPRLFSAHADLYDVQPKPSVHGEPSVMFRGLRCVRCERVVSHPDDLVDGLGPECR